MFTTKLNALLTNVRPALTLQSSFSLPRTIYKQNCSDPVWNVRARGYSTPSGTPGSGAGKGGGAGGSIRASGGGLGKYGAAQEEGYFYDKQKEQLKKLKKKLKDKPDQSEKQDK